MRTLSLCMWICVCVCVYNDHSHFHFYQQMCFPLENSLIWKYFYYISIEHWAMWSKRDSHSNKQQQQQQQNQKLQSNWSRARDIWVLLFFIFCITQTTLQSHHHNRALSHQFISCIDPTRIKPSSAQHTHIFGGNKVMAMMIEIHSFVFNEQKSLIAFSASIFHLAILKWEYFLLPLLPLSPSRLHRCWCCVCEVRVFICYTQTLSISPS